MPARRPGGKAASRKARQRYVPRTTRPASPVPTPEPEDVAAAGSVPDVIGPDVPIDVPAAPATRASVPASARRRPTPVAATPTGSGLSARERADYHYVERDLRNIGILTLIMAALLLGAWLLFNAIGPFG